MSRRPPVDVRVCRLDELHGYEVHREGPDVTRLIVRQDSRTPTQLVRKSVWLTLTDEQLLELVTALLEVGPNAS